MAWSRSRTDNSQHVSGVSFADLNSSTQGLLVHVHAKRMTMSDDDFMFQMVSDNSYVEVFARYDSTTPTLEYTNTIDAGSFVVKQMDLPASWTQFFFLGIGIGTIGSFKYQFFRGTVDGVSTSLQSTLTSRNLGNIDETDVLPITSYNLGGKHKDSSLNGEGWGGLLAHFCAWEINTTSTGFSDKRTDIIDAADAIIDQVYNDGQNIPPHHADLSSGMPTNGSASLQIYQPLTSDFSATIGSITLGTGNDAGGGTFVSNDEPALYMVGAADVVSPSILASAGSAQGHSGAAQAQAGSLTASLSGAVAAPTGIAADLPAVTASLSATQRFNASLSANLGSAVADIAGASIVTGAAAPALSSPTNSADGRQKYSGVADSDLSVLSASGVAALSFVGVAATIMKAIEASADGATLYVAAIVADLPAPDAAAFGVGAQSGDIDASLSSINAEADGKNIRTGAIDADTAAPTTALSGIMARAGTAVGELSSPTATAAGRVGALGALNGALGSLSHEALGAFMFSAAIDAGLSPARADAVGQVIRSAAIDSDLPTLGAALSAHNARAGAATGSLASPSASLTGRRGSVGAIDGDLSSLQSSISSNIRLAGNLDAHLAAINGAADALTSTSSVIVATSPTLQALASSTIIYQVDIGATAASPDATLAGQTTMSGVIDVIAASLTAFGTEGVQFGIVEGVKSFTATGRLTGFSVSARNQTLNPGNSRGGSS